MDIYEITALRTGVDNSGVNYLQAKDSFELIENGFIYRDVLQSRRGISLFAPRLANTSRIFAIFEFILPNGTTECLAIDQNFLYKYNTTTGIFDQIPFGGTLAGYTGFNISAKDLYVSGTAYPTALNAARFVFTGEGMAIAAGGSAVFFYNGTDVRDYTAVADNPDYVAPTSGALTRAKYVMWFGERLNFISPRIAGIIQNQAILYSGIRDSTGNGDDYNAPGSGLLLADTYENIKGAAILGQIISLQFDRSNWALEKTRDAFNPYFIRKIPSILGSSANFSSVAWSDTVKAMGRTGIISTDGRQSLRTDNKIPYFTEDEIDATNFNLTYGGFDRINGQFLWSYLSAGSVSDTQDKVLVNNYEEGTWSTYDIRLTVFGQTIVRRELAWNQIDETVKASWGRWDTTEELWNRIGIEAATQKTLAGDDLGYIYDINSDFDDYVFIITGISQASQAVLTIGANPFKVGDLVAVENVAGMTEINNFTSGEANINFVPYEVVAVGATTITLNVNSSLFTAYTTAGTVSKIIPFQAKMIPFNPYREIGRKVYVSHVEVLIDNTGSVLKMDVSMDEEDSPFKRDIILAPSITSNKAREWITISVDQEANFITFTFKHNSPGSQYRQTSCRIHCKPGALTSG